MEKFGIFELLDALSAFASAGKEPQEDARPDANTSAFAPPSYGAAYDPVQNPAPEPPSQKKQEDALSALLARHDALSKKIDDKR